MIVVEIDIVDGRPAPVALSIEPTVEPPPDSIRTDLLRSLRLVQVVREHLADRRGRVPGALRVEGPSSEFQPDVPDWLIERLETETVLLEQAPRGPGRPVQLTDKDYQAVADVYRDAFGYEPVLEAIARTFYITRSTAAKRVKEARRRKYLPPTSRGKARA